MVQTPRCLLDSRMCRLDPPCTLEADVGSGCHCTRAMPTTLTRSRTVTRRSFLQRSAAGLAGLGLALPAARCLAQRPGEQPALGERPPQAPQVHIRNPRARVPVSLIIDDSTCLVNLAHFKIPQFASVWPDRYQQDWRKLPREIPDSFVRSFAEWCREHGVKGKYTVVPYPACVGWLDRFLPGWTRAELEASLKLLREELAADWDFHPEMVTHTWVIDTKTGRPYEERSPAFIENAGWSQDKSADVLAEYMAYALRILKNVGLECEGITTPGGFGSQNRANLARATLDACREVFDTEVPHYFRDLFDSGEQSVSPQVYYAADLEGDDPRCVVSVIGCTGDWFGGWDGLEPGSVDRFITADLHRGRLPQVIDREEPAILVCHWPGMYFNGEQLGFHIFQEVVRRLHSRYDNLIWMKLSEIARYWAARELTRIELTRQGVLLTAPFATRLLTMAVPAGGMAMPKLTAAGKPITLHEVNKPLELVSGTFCRQGQTMTVCFDLPKGRTLLET